MSVLNPKETSTSINEIQTIVAVVDTNGNSLLDNYLSRNGDIMTGNLILEGNDTKIIFQNGSTQEVAFDEGKITQLDYLID